MEVLRHAEGMIKSKPGVWWPELGVDGGCFCWAEKGEG